jgi:hypothetical protein
MFRIDEQLREFVESGLPAVVGTANPAGRPHVAYGWATRVLDDRATMEVFLDSARSERTLANLHTTGRIALTLADPVSYRSVQFKGVFRDSGEPSDADREWVQRGREAFATAVALIGDPPSVIRNLWLDDVVRVTFEVERAFDQTPGPEAGRPL